PSGKAVLAPMTLQWMDDMRRQIGAAWDVIGLGPQEHPWRTAADFRGARLRAYNGQCDASGPIILIIPAPFKRAYIWDLLPCVSVVRHCLRRGASVYLLEWLPPTKAQDGLGLAEYGCQLPSTAIDVIKSETGVSTPILAGHSLRWNPRSHLRDIVFRARWRACSSRRPACLRRAWQPSRKSSQTCSACALSPLSDRQSGARLRHQRAECSRSAGGLSRPAPGRPDRQCPRPDGI